MTNPTIQSNGIQTTILTRLADPVRDTALALEHWGPGYRVSETILRRHLQAAAVEIAEAAR